MGPNFHFLLYETSAVWEFPFLHDNFILKLILQFSLCDLSRKVFKMTGNSKITARRRAQAYPQDLYAEKNQPPRKKLFSNSTNSRLGLILERFQDSSGKFGFLTRVKKTPVPRIIVLQNNC